MPLIDRLRSHTQSLKPTAKDAAAADDDTSVVWNEWQTLYSQHFSSTTNPTAASIPRFHFPTTTHSSLTATDDQPTTTTTAKATADSFRLASHHNHLQRLADRLLTDDELNDLCQRIIQQHQPPASASRRHSLTHHAHAVSASVTSTSLDHSNTFASHVPALHDIHLSYTRFMALGSVLPVHKRGYHINAQTFALFPRTTSQPTASISALLLLTHLLYTQLTTRLRLQLSFYTDHTTSHSHVSEEQLMHYVHDELAGQAELAGVLDGEFVPFYVFSVVRKFVFFVDGGRRGRMSVRELAHSSLLHEWEQRKTALSTAAAADSAPMDTLRQALALAASSASAAGLLSIGATTLSSNLFSCTDPGRLNTSSSASASTTPRPSWFSLQSSQAIYALYLSLDRNQNGMLSQSELAHFQSGAYTTQLLDALYSSVALYPSTTAAVGEAGEEAVVGVLEMDYKAFLDFVLAVEYCHTAAALTYWFRLLDYRCVGYLDSECVRYWYGGVRRRLAELGHEQLPSVDVVQSEVFDMVGVPRDWGGSVGDRISLRDLIECKCGHTVVQILVNVTGFWRYDHRESLLQQQQQQQ